jgi:hypothetical protein
LFLLSSPVGKTAQEILAKLAETVATEVATDILSRLTTELANWVGDRFSLWFNSNFNYAGQVYRAAQPIPSTNGDRPLERIPFEEFYRRVTTAHQLREQYRQYLNYLISWSRLTPQQRYQVLINSGHYQDSGFTYDQIVANLFTNLLNMYASMYR